MINIKTIYPSKEGDVTEIVSLEDAIAVQEQLAAMRGHMYITKQEVIDDILACPCTTRTREAVGKTVKPRLSQAQAYQQSPYLNN